MKLAIHSKEVDYRWASIMHQSMQLYRWILDTCILQTNSEIREMTASKVMHIRVQVINGCYSTDIKIDVHIIIRSIRTWSLLSSQQMQRKNISNTYFFVNSKDTFSVHSNESKNTISPSFQLDVSTLLSSLSPEDSEHEIKQVSLFHSNDPWYLWYTVEIRKLILIIIMLL